MEPILPLRSANPKAVVDSVKAGIIPAAEAENVFICVGVFIHWEAKDDAKIQDWNLSGDYTGNRSRC